MHVGSEWRSVKQGRTEGSGTASFFHSETTMGSSEHELIPTAHDTDIPSDKSEESVRQVPAQSVPVNCDGLAPTPVAGGRGAHGSQHQV